MRALRVERRRRQSIALESTVRFDLRKRAASSVGLALASALVACADRPEVDQIAQASMIGLSRADIRACLGEPASRSRVAEGTEIWTYPVGVTTTETPPWGLGLDFSAIAPREACDVRLVMTNGRVSQVAYSSAGGRALPAGRQCSFPVRQCASRRDVL